MNDDEAPTVPRGAAVIEERESQRKTQPPPPPKLTLCPQCGGHGIGNLEQVGESLWWRTNCPTCKGVGEVEAEYAELWLSAWSGGET